MKQLLIGLGLAMCVLLSCGPSKKSTTRHLYSADSLARMQGYRGADTGLYRYEHLKLTLDWEYSQGPRPLNRKTIAILAGAIFISGLLLGKFVLKGL
jgi:hypothetical protein